MEHALQKSIRIDNPRLDHTEKLLEQVLIPILQQEARVRFLCLPSEGEPIVQRLRVMISRKRKSMESKGKKAKRFRLHSSIHSETHEGKRFDCVVLWKSVSELHVLTEELEDLLQHG